MEELEQLSIFDTPSDMVVLPPVAEELSSMLLTEEINMLEETPYIEHEIVPYDVGDSVRVDPDSLDENDVLNYNYLLDYLKKKGIVTKVIHKPTLQYEVAYGDTIACMYHKDLTI